MSKMTIMTTAVVAIAAILTGCHKTEDSKDIGKAWCCHGMSCYTKAVEIEGHKYIIMDGSYCGTIIHAASCECMKK